VRSFRSFKPFPVDLRDSTPVLVRYGRCAELLGTERRNSGPCPCAQWRRRDPECCLPTKTNQRLLRRDCGRVGGSGWQGFSDRAGDPIAFLKRGRDRHLVRAEDYNDHGPRRASITRLASTTISSVRLFSRLEGLSANARVDPGAKMAALQPFPTGPTSIRYPLYSITVICATRRLLLNGPPPYGQKGPPARGGPVEFRRASPRKQAAARLRTQWRFSAPLVAEERSPVGLRTGVLAARPRRPEIPEHRDELPSCPC
jgi:hypothetical protein